MIFLLLQFIDFKAQSRYKFLRFLSGLVSLPTQCQGRPKSYENLLTAVNETRPFEAHCKKDILERLRVPPWPSAIVTIVTQKMETLPMCWSFLIGLTKVHALIGKVKNALRIIEKHCDAFKVFKLVKNAFHSSAAVTRASREPILQCVTLL